MTAAERTVFRPGGDRLVVYRVRGFAAPLDDYVLIALRSLREHAAHILVLVGEEPEPSDRERLAEVCDEILVDPAEDAALSAWLEAREHDGSRFDEVVLTDDSWFGPVAALGSVLERMDQVATDAWTMTPAGRTDGGAWISVRRPRSEAGAWDRLLGEARRHAVAGTQIDSAEIVVDCAFPGSAGVEDPVLVESARLLAAGCPLLARRVFTTAPPVLERHAVIGRALLAAAADNGYPPGAILQNLARTVAPNRLNASLSLLEIPSRRSGAHAPAFESVVLAHFAHGTDPAELARRIGLIPGDCRVVATVGTAEDERIIRPLLADARGVGAGDIEVRRVPPAADPASATFVGCRDILLDGRQDIVINLHSGPFPGTTVNARRYLRRHTWENLLGSREHAERVLGLFRDPGLGFVLPPTPHIGVDTLGSGWAGGRGDAERIARLLGIRVPLGEAPLAPVGGMWIGRTAALRVLAGHEWSWRDYLPASGWGSLARTQEALLAHAAGTSGFHTRTVLTAEHAAISHAPLEYKIDQLASTTPGFPADKIALLHRLGAVGDGRARDFLRMNRRARRASAQGGLRDD